MPGKTIVCHHTPEALETIRQLNIPAGTVLTVEGPQTYNVSAKLPPEEEIRAIARSIGKPVRFASETEAEAKLRRLKEYQRAGELLNQLVDRNATLAVQVAAAKEVVRNDLELLGTRATRILALEEMMGRCLAVWQNNPSWDNRELLAEAQALLNEERA